jgi:hypothetical protein
MSELKITKEKVLEAAKGCKDAEKVLKTLFPEVFEDDKYIDLKTNELNFNRSYDKSELIGLPIRTGGKYKNKSIYLNIQYDWEIVTDDEGSKCLVPTKKI